MSSEEEEHSVSNASGARNWEDSPLLGVDSPDPEQSEEEGEEEEEEEDGPEEEEEEEEKLPMPQSKKGKEKAGISKPLKPRKGKSSTRPSQGPMAEVSRMTEADLSWIRHRYQIPDEFRLRLPRAGERVQNPPPRSLAIYEEDLVAGLRFPFHTLVIQILARYNVVPAQLAPNSIRSMIGFIILCSLLKIKPRFSLFRCLFQLNKVPGKGGWWVFVPRKKKKVVSLPSSIHNWKNRYFFVSPDYMWGFSAGWEEPDISLNRRDQVYDSDKKDFKKLIGAKAPRFQDLITDQNLQLANIAVGFSEMQIGREAIYRAIKNKAPKKKKKAPEGENQPEGKRQKVGESSEIPEMPIFDVPSGDEGGDLGPALPVRVPAPDPLPSSVGTSFPEPVPDASGEVPTAAVNDVAPEEGEATCPDIPASAPRQPDVQGQGRGKEIVVPAHSTVRRTSSASPRSSGGRPVPEAAEPSQRDQTEESHRAFFSRPRGVDDWELRAHLKNNDSVIQDPYFAFEYFNNLALPLDKKAMEGWSNRKLIEQEIIGSVQGLYRSFMLRNMMLHHAGRINSLTKQKKELEDKLAKAERDREEEVRRANFKLGEVSSERESLRIQLKISQEKTDLAEGRLSVVEGEKKALEDKAISLSSLLKITSNSLALAETRLAASEEKVSAGRSLLDKAEEEVREIKKQAEEDRRSVEAELLKARTEILEAKEQQQAAEICAQTAEVKIQKAVTNYKASVAFEDDVANAGIGMYFTGFEDCKNLVSGAFPGTDLSKIIPPGTEEDEEDEEEEQSANSEADQPVIPLPPVCPETSAGAAGTAEGNDLTTDP